MEEIEDEPLFADRVAGLDIAKAAAEVTIRVPSDTAAGRRRQETPTFGATRRELLDLAAWLQRWEVTKAGMEATGDYRKPVFFLPGSQGLDCELYNAGQVKALPGRPKTDRAEPGGRDMPGALAAGQRDPKALAQLARGSMHGKISRLEDALDCSFFTGQHAAVLAMMLAAIDYHSAQIETLTATIEELAEPWMRQLEQPGAVPGIGPICAQDITGESGTDMTVFATAPHLVSWARWSPQVKQSAGKRKGSNSTGRGNPCPGAAPGEAVIGASRTPSFPGARYRRLARRMPKKKALAGRQLHAHHRPRPARRPGHGLSRPRPRLLRTAHAHPPPSPQPHPQPRTPRLQSHHPGHRPRHRRTSRPGQLTTFKQSPAARHRTLPRAQLGSHFRTRRARSVSKPSEPVRYFG